MHRFLVFCMTLCACMWHPARTEPITTYHITECASHSHSATGVEGEDCVCDAGYARSASGDCVGLPPPGGGGGEPGPQPQPTPPSGGGGGAGPTSGGGTVLMDAACARAAQGCPGAVNSVVNACAVARCLVQYCEQYPCTDDERRKARDATEAQEHLHCENENLQCGKGPSLRPRPKSNNAE
jgi:hypothetical protein